MIISTFPLSFHDYNLPNLYFGQLDKERCAQSSNYRQLMLARGQRAVEETPEERASRCLIVIMQNVYLHVAGRPQGASPCSGTGPEASKPSRTGLLFFATAPTGSSTN